MVLKINKVLSLVKQTFNLYFKTFEELLENLMHYVKILMKFL